MYENDFVILIIIGVGNGVRIVEVSVAIAIVNTGNVVVVASIVARSAVACIVVG